MPSPVQKTNVVTFKKARAPRSHITQRLLLTERILTEQILELTSQRDRLREKIRSALNHGQKCEEGFHSAKISVRHVLQIR